MRQDVDFHLNVQEAHELNGYLETLTEVVPNTLDTYSFIGYCLSKWGTLNGEDDGLSPHHYRFTARLLFCFMQIPAYGGSEEILNHSFAALQKDDGDEMVIERKAINVFKQIIAKAEGMAWANFVFRMEVFPSRNVTRMPHRRFDSEKERYDFFLKVRDGKIKGEYYDH